MYSNKKKTAIITNHPFSKREKCLELYLRLGLPVLTIESMSFIISKGFHELPAKELAMWKFFILPASLVQFEVYATGKIEKMGQCVVATYKLNELIDNEYSALNIITKDFKIKSIGK